MAKHPMTAIKATIRKDGIRLVALTRSPRGTQIAYKQLKLPLTGEDREERLYKLEEAVTQLVAE